jgi:hypothetical protein
MDQGFIVRQGVFSSYCNTDMMMIVNVGEFCLTLPAVDNSLFIC